MGVIPSNRSSKEARNHGCKGGAAGSQSKELKDHGTVVRLLLVQVLTIFCMESSSEIKTLFDCQALI